MVYVAQHTSIPVPKVYSSFLHRNRAYIIMERSQGENLAQAWKKLSEESLQKIFSQLRDMMQELRRLKPPPDLAVGSCTGDSLYDSRLPHGTPRFGPFETAQEFHRWLRRGLEASQQCGKYVTQQEADAVKALIAQQDGEWTTSVFTHCDLNPTNILVRGDEIVGIIDWEFAGWFPPYWEYTSAWRGNVLRSRYQDILLSLLDPYPEELAMEKTRCQWWGEW